jgi:hypothetical protein
MNLKANSGIISLFFCSLSPIHNLHAIVSPIVIITIALALLSSQFSLFSYNIISNDFVAFASPSQQESTPSGLSLPQVEENADISADNNFNLPDGYIIEPFLLNLSMPTSIAVDSTNGTIYVAESISQYDNSSSNMPFSYSTPSDSLTSPISLTSQKVQPQVRIIKSDTSDANDAIIANQSSGSSDGDNDVRTYERTNTTVLFDNVLNWPVIDMKVDDTKGLLYAFHDSATISRINVSSGEREDILVSEEEQPQEASVGNDQYGEGQDDLLSVLKNSSSQIALSGNEVYNDDGGGVENEPHGGSNYDGYSYAFPHNILYTPCGNGSVDNDQGAFCILGLPIDTSINNTILENINRVNSPSFILQNMTSRPIGIAVLNFSYALVSSPSSASSSSSSPSGTPEQQIAHTLIGSLTSDPFRNNNYTELLVIGSQPTYNGIFGAITNNNNNPDPTAVGYHGTDYSGDTELSSLSTIYRAKIFGSTLSQNIINNNLQDTVSNNDYGNSSSSNYPPHVLTTSIEPLTEYPDGELGKVAVVPVLPNASFLSNNEIETSNASSIDEDDENDLSASSSSSSPPFGLNKTSAFIIDFGNSSTSATAPSPQLPKIIMLDVETGSITPFLTPASPESGFMPIDIAFDHNNKALYVLSIGSNQEEHTDITNDTSSNLLNTDSLSNNSGLIWKISYQGQEQESATSNHSDRISNGTDNGNNATSDLTTPPPPPTPSSSNDTDSSSNRSDSNGLDDLPPPPPYDEGQDDTDDDSTDTDDDSTDTDDDSTDTDDDSTDTDNGNNDSNEDTDDNSDSGGSSSPPSPPSTEPVNNSPIAQEDVAATDQDTSAVIDVLANDKDADAGDSLTIDSIDEESIQGGNVRIVSSDTGDDGDDNNDNESNTNERIEYTPAEGFIGTDEFTYTIVDSNGATDSARVTVTVNQVIIAPHPISYWLENENGITQELLERAAAEHDNDNNDEEQEEWSFNLGNFRVPVEFDVSDSENDTRGILEAAQGSNNDDEEEEEEDNSANANDQLSAQLLAAKLNIENGVSTCEPIVTTIEYTDTVLRDALYNGPGSTGDPTDESRDYAFELMEILDRFNNNGCV